MQKTIPNLNYSPQPLPVLGRREPAARIIELFNSSPQKRDGARRLAEHRGLHVHTVDRWRLAKEHGGTGGWIPRKHHDWIVAFAQELGITIEKENFL